MARRFEPLALSEAEKTTLREEGYVIESAFAAGAFGTIFHASLKKNNEKRALVVKQINRARKSWADSAAIELAILRDCRHEYIVELVHHFRAATGHELLFLEAMEGGSLKDVMDDYEMDETNMSQMYRQFGSALAFLHANGFAHRDLKPGNILISDDFEVVKLADFGLVMKCINENGEPILIKGSCGTKAYMAPEVLLHGAFFKEESIHTEPDPYWPILTDVWSMGILVYVMLHRGEDDPGFPFEKPFPEFYWNIHKAVKTMFRRTKPRELNPNESFGSRQLVLPTWHQHSPHFERFLRRHLQYRPENRSSMAELLEDEWFTIAAAAAAQSKKSKETSEKKLACSVN